MVCASTLLKDLLSVNHCVIESYDLVTNDNGVKTLKVHLHPLKSYSDRCSGCGKRCPVYDRSPNYRKWQDLDSSNEVIVELYSKTQRICCKEHGIKTASVPWAFKDSGFTTTFDLMATFLAMNINKPVAAQYLRCDWHTIMRCISRVREFLEPDLIKLKLITKKSFQKKCGADFFISALSFHNCFKNKILVSSELNVYPCVMERRICHGN